MVKNEQQFFETRMVTNEQMVKEQIFRPGIQFKTSCKRIELSSSLPAFSSTSDPADEEENKCS